MNMSKRRNIVMGTVIALIAMAAVLISFTAALWAETGEAQVPVQPSLGPEERNVPVLLFHHLDEKADNDVTVTPGYFEEAIRSLRDEGYTAISTADLVAYVDGEGELPDKPVMITFDDGYESNITLAAPILEKYDMHAVVFAIGISAGKDTYKDTGVAITPHFSWEQAKQFSHVVEIQSHTFDMHQVSILDGPDCRPGVLQMEGEDTDKYENTFKSDFLHSRRDIEDNLDTEVTAFAYPYGMYNELTEEWLREMGIRITMSIEERVSTVKRGDDGSLLLLGRFSITEGEDAIGRITQE